jgi:hypothetical protein
MSGGAWATEKSAAVSTAATTAPARGARTQPAIAWLRYPRNRYSSAADCSGVVSATTRSSQPNDGMGPVTSSSPNTKDTTTENPIAVPSEASARTTYRGRRRQRSRASTDDDQPLPMPCATDQAIHTVGMATIRLRLVTSRTTGSTRSNSARSGPMPVRR